MCRPFRGAQIWEEEHAGLFDDLQLDWRSERGCYAGTGSRDFGPDQWRESVYAVVSVCAVRFCYWDARDGDHFLKRKY